MKVFISWSGEVSKQVARILRDWLPQVINEISPFMSSEDIEKGARGLDIIAKELEGSTFGILCISADNFSRPWVNFEAGALSKQIATSKVVPLLFNVDYATLTGPITQFQHVLPTEDDTRKLLRDLNLSCQDPRSETQLDKAFAKWWPDLKEMFDAISLSSNQPDQRDLRDVMDEVLSIVRGIQRYAPPSEEVDRPPLRRIYMEYLGTDPERFSSLLVGIKRLTSKYHLSMANRGNKISMTGHAYETIGRRITDLITDCSIRKEDVDVVIESSRGDEDVFI